jgi:hypothetical protein
VCVRILGEPLALTCFDAAFPTLPRATSTVVKPDQTCFRLCIRKWTVRISAELPAIILPVVLYGCETWPLTLREKHRLGVFENRMLKRMFGPKRDEVTGEWRKLHNEELHNLYSSPS